jgi:hypothetical protein
LNQEIARNVPIEEVINNLEFYGNNFPQKPETLTWGWINDTCSHYANCVINGNTLEFHEKVNFFQECVNVADNFIKTIF